MVQEMRGGSAMEKHQKNDNPHNTSAQAELWELVNDLDDLLRYGYRRQDRPKMEEPAPSSVQDTLSAIQEEVEHCTLCSLHEKRTHTVPGTGDTQDVQVMVIGEAPGMEEDKQGLPFVGPAGQYLDKWLAAIGLTRNRGAFIANTVKCRPPGNRDPLQEETAQCMPYLLRQIALLKPRTILCAGRISTSILLERNVRIGRDRGKWFKFQGIPLIATYHPSAVLRNPELRRPVWQDLQKLRSALDSNTFNDRMGS